MLYSGKDEKHETPLSYTEARRSFDKIRKKFDILDYTAHDFRDTCATQWRESGMPLDMIARILGHSKTETTEKRYVKYRGEMMEKAREMM
jgi:integrase